MRRSYVCAVFAISLAAGVCDDGARSRCLQIAVDNVNSAAEMTRVPKNYGLVDDRSLTVGILEEGK